MKDLFIRHMYIQTHSFLTIKDNDTQTNHFGPLCTFRRHAGISMLSPQHPCSPGSCVGPLRCGKILHAPGLLWPLSYGCRTLCMCTLCVRACVCGNRGTHRQNDDGRNCLCMCFFCDSVISPVTFSSNQHENLFLLIHASMVYGCP